MGVNERTIEEHIRKIGMPYTWGTHIEILAVATFFDIPVYIIRQKSSGIYYWEETKPLNKPDGFSHPVVPASTSPFPNEYEPPNHLELDYTSGVHYDSVVGMVTEKVPEHVPQKKPCQVFADMTGAIIIN